MRVERELKTATRAIKYWKHGPLVGDECRSHVGQRIFISNEKEIKDVKVED
jgi:hypothetical protein